MPSPSTVPQSDGSAGPNAGPAPPRLGVREKKKRKQRDPDRLPGGPQHAQARRSLPIAAQRQAIVDALGAHRTLVLVGETGSGKTTQVPQFLLESGLLRRGTLACTQPRRVAAMTVAQRVAEEQGSRLGARVGYSVRFDDRTSRATRIKFATDGMLLREAMVDPDLSRYACIVLDEAHERTLQTDVLFALVKQLMLRREDLRVVVMSATLDVELFQGFFPDAATVRVPGREHPVDMFYMPEPAEDYVDAALVATLQLHEEDQPGDILVFLTGQEEIETMQELLEERARRLPAEQLKLVVCPLFAAMPPEQQLAAFEPAPAGARKVVLATNIAETSVTIDGIRTVIDPGMVKRRVFHPATGVESLRVVPVSQAQAWQRAGRAGRQGPGRCFRLFTEDSFDGLEKTTPPEILRCDLANAMLQLHAMGIAQPQALDFVQRPAGEALAAAFRRLRMLDALDADGALTPLGARMAQLPLDPAYARLVLEAGSHACAEEVVIVVAMLSTDAVFVSPRGQRDLAKAAHDKLRAHEGDHLTLLRVFRAFWRHRTDKRWCRDNFVNYRALAKAADIRAQLLEHLRRLEVPVESCAPDPEPVLRCLAAACFANAAQAQPAAHAKARRVYKCAQGGHIVAIHPSSALFGRSPECIVYGELYDSTKLYARQVSAVDPEWFPTRFMSRSSVAAGSGGARGRGQGRGQRRGKDRRGRMID